MGDPARCRPDLCGDRRAHCRRAGVCIVNESLARRQFGDRSPLGDVILRGRNANERYEIVGVVADVKTNGLTAAPPDEIFYPFWQIPRPNVAIVAKARQDPHALKPIFRGAVSDADRLLAVARFGSLEENLSATLGPQRVLAGVTTAFAALALALASIGLYTVPAPTCRRGALKSVSAWPSARVGAR